MGAIINLEKLKENYKVHNLINLINNFANNCPALREIINQPFPTFQRQSLLERIFFSLHRHYEIFIWHLCFENRLSKLTFSVPGFV